MGLNIVWRGTSTIWLKEIPVNGSHQLTKFNCRIADDCFGQNSSRSRQHGELALHGTYTTIIRSYSSLILKVRSDVREVQDASDRSYSQITKGFLFDEID
jgi:hypothetical protein